jgi:hypothetical protein
MPLLWAILMFGQSEATMFIYIVMAIWSIPVLFGLYLNLCTVSMQSYANGCDYKVQNSWLLVTIESTFRCVGGAVSTTVSLSLT